MDAQHLLITVIRPTLEMLGRWTEASEKLVLYTACQESHLEYLRQLGMEGIGRGSSMALGLFQMEKATHDDIWVNYLRHRPGIATAVRQFELEGLYDDDNYLELAGNLYYAAAMCRVHYLRVPEALPRADDLRGLANYWKRYYNTSAGHGTPQQFIDNAHRYGGA